MSKIDISSKIITLDGVIYGHGIDDNDVAFFVHITPNSIDGVTPLVKIDGSRCNLINIKTNQSLGHIGFVPNSDYSKTIFVPANTKFRHEIIGRWHYDTEEKLLKFLCQNKPSAIFIDFLEKGY